MEISVEDALKANTILVNTERKMPKALGEFGKSKHSETSNKIIEILSEAKKPINANELYKKVSQDLNKLSDLLDILKSLTDADKIQLVKGGTGVGYGIKHTMTKDWHKDLVLDNYLLLEEIK